MELSKALDIHCLVLHQYQNLHLTAQLICSLTEGAATLQSHCKQKNTYLGNYLKVFKVHALLF